MPKQEWTQADQDAQDLLAAQAMQQQAMTKPKSTWQQLPQAAPQVPAEQNPALTQEQRYEAFKTPNVLPPQLIQEYKNDRAPSSWQGVQQTPTPANPVDPNLWNNMQQGMKSVR